MMVNVRNICWFSSHNVIMYESCLQHTPNEVFDAVKLAFAHCNDEEIAIADNYVGGAEHEICGQLLDCTEIDEYIKVLSIVRPLYQAMKSNREVKGLIREVRKYGNHNQ